MEEADKMMIFNEMDREKTPEKEGHVEIKQSGKMKKGKIAEGRSEKETPSAKEKRTPQGRAKENNSKRKKVSIQEAEKSVKLPGHFGKENEACDEDKEMEQLKEELYQERRKKEDLVRERIRLERQNDKLFIKNNHLKRKQTEHNTQRGENASGKKLATEGCHEYWRDRKGRGEQNEREDLRRAIESSGREFREKEYRMQQLMVKRRKGATSNDPVTGRKSGTREELEMMNKCARSEPCKPEIAALFSLKQRGNESLRNIVSRWDTLCK
ncbi:histone-lysine N-methyltransferase, H3 lysine-79 specific-like [Papaver somniferum]|uniref:histone-lysine N-methyltransferase, H3 lysine-79 specific-like n=1 Tax=Papaver somniferum TaxID=3469 RepID=UPI000E6FB51C|nr:histone-lysine N-methyltransferase, H3 lysine-79 specific-like [Papaver somniferum]